MKLYIVLSAVLGLCYGRSGFGPGEQEWGYAEVRKGAHMFWWLYYTTANVVDYTERPLVIWLQGGPGASSTYYGNFEEFGPLDTNLEERESTWVKDVNVLYIDNPVGTGFSYVDDYKLLTKTNQEIANDLVELMRLFYEQLPEFKKVPLYITAESYGGKMTADFALTLDKAIKDGKIQCDLRGVALGDSWISPIDSVLTWGPYLYHIGMVSKEGAEYIQESAKETQELLEKGYYNEATEQWSETEYRIMVVGHDVDFYNVLTQIYVFGKRRLVKPGIKPRQTSDQIMIQVKEALGLDHFWDESSYGVFSTLSGDFMKPVTDSVELLLNTTDVKVFVFNGQLDLIVDTPGTVQWVDRLKWKNSVSWPNVDRKAVVVNSVIEGFVKTSGNLALYWVNRAGHMVPADNPAAMGKILKDLTNNFSVN